MSWDAFETVDKDFGDDYEKQVDLNINEIVEIPGCVVAIAQTSHHCGTLTVLIEQGSVQE